MPTPEAIRALDGPALDFLAYTLGLAPARLPAGISSAWFATHAWHPHTILRQADAVFRRLRARGWNTSHEYHQIAPCYIPQIKRGGCGCVAAYHPATGAHLFAQYRDEAQEAHALLLVSVLALCHCQASDAPASDESH